MRSPLAAGSPTPSRSSNNSMPCLSRIKITQAPAGLISTLTGVGKGKHYARAYRSLPPRRIADLDVAIVQDFRKRAAAPITVHRRLQPGQDLVHSLAGFVFPADLQSRSTDA